MSARVADGGRQPPLEPGIDSRREDVGLARAPTPDLESYRPALEAALG